MTTTTVEIPKPDLMSPQGSYGGSRVSHVKNLLARATVAGSATELTPEIIRKMRRHYQVNSCLVVQSLPLIRADWSIECEDPDHADRLGKAYDAISFHLHRSMTKALPHGYSPNELVWDYVASLKLLAPVEIRDYEPKSCKPGVDDTGKLDGFEQLLDGKPAEIDPIYTLWIVEGMESGNLYGRSILDAALEPWQDYAAIRAFHARYLERFGEPTVIARAPAGTSITNAAEINRAITANETAGLNPGDAGYEIPPQPNVVSNLDTALEVGTNLRHHSVVALPSTLVYGTDNKPTGYAWQLEFLESKGGSGGEFIEALRELDKRIARAMFVPDLLITNTEDVGSNALGQTHRNVWEDAVEGRLDDYSRQVTEQLIEPMRVLNFGADSPPARLVFSPLSDAALDRAWELVKILADGGHLPADVRALADKLEIPLLEEGEELDPSTEEDPPVDPPPAEDLRHRHPLTGLAAGDQVVEGLPEWKLPQSYDPPPWSRSLNDREERVGFAALEDGLNRAERETVAMLEEILDDEHDKILRQLKAIVRKGSAREVIAAIGTLELKATPKVARAWSDLMGEVGNVALEQLAGELAAYAAQLPETNGPDSRAMFTAYATTSAERVVASLLTETRLSLLNAYTSGVTSRPGLAAIVGQVFDSYAANEGKPVRLTTRMLSAKSLNYSRAAAVEAAGIPLAGAQYSALLDRRTCELCRKLDEKVIPIEHTDLARFTPPIHHNCRCLWVWITRDEADFTPTWSTPSKSDVDRFGGLVI